MVKRTYEQSISGLGTETVVGTASTAISQDAGNIESNTLQESPEFTQYKSQTGKRTGYDFEYTLSRFQGNIKFNGLKQGDVFYYALGAKTSVDYSGVWEHVLTPADSDDNLGTFSVYKELGGATPIREIFKGCKINKLDWEIKEGETLMVDIECWSINKETPSNSTTITIAPQIPFRFADIENAEITMNSETFQLIGAKGSLSNNLKQNQKGNELDEAIQTNFVEEMEVVVISNLNSLKQLKDNKTSFQVELKVKRGEDDYILFNPTVKIIEMDEGNELEGAVERTVKLGVETTRIVIKNDSEDLEL